MVALVKFVDEFPARGRGAPVNLHLVSETVTAREIITRRVVQEVELAKKRGVEISHSFIIRFDPTVQERALNRAACPKPVLLDEAEEVETAIDGFLANKFIMLVDDRQVGGLDEPITLTPGSEVVFLRLTPLAGG